MAQLKGYYIQPPSDLNLVRVQTSKSASGTASVTEKFRQANFGNFTVTFYGPNLIPEKWNIVDTIPSTAILNGALTP